MAAATQLPVPSFFNPANAEDYNFDPDLQELLGQAMQWRREHGIRPSGSDRVKIHFLEIDSQKDFCHPNGKLYVAGRSGRGATDSTVRSVVWVYKNLHRITDYTDTFDTHLSHQISFNTFWVDRHGVPANPFTVITNDMVKDRELVPNPEVAWWLCEGNYAWLLKYAEHYTSELARKGNYPLILWPFHTMLGSSGHALMGVTQQARMFHSFCRGSASWSETKGANFLTENYSPFSVEVDNDQNGEAIDQRNTVLINKLLRADYVVTRGEAGSHCFRSATKDILTDILDKDPTLARKIYILKDCTSAVVIRDGNGNIIPDADFTPKMEEAFQEFSDAGMHLVDSTTPMEEWPDMRLS